MVKPQFASLLLVVVANAFAALPAPIEIHVSQSGNDDWSGRTAARSGRDGPLRTLGAAQAAARARLAGHPPGGVQVVIHPGRWVLEEPLLFGPADSGTEAAPMVYRAAEPGTVILSGGRALARRTGDSVPTIIRFAPPPAVGPSFWASAPQLYVDGRRAVLARMPKIGQHWFVTQVVPVAGEAADNPGAAAFRPTPEAMDWLRRLSNADRERAWLQVMQSWTSSRHRLSSLPAPPGAVRVEPPAHWPFLHFGTSQRWWIENVEAAFDQAGEWIGDDSGVSYRPRPGETVHEAMLPVLERLVVIRGTGPAGPWVEHLELRDLAFEYQLWPTPAGGWIDPFAAYLVGAAIEADFARDLRIEGCRAAHIGGYAIWLRESVRESVVEGCHFEDLGAGAVKVGTAGQGRDENASGANRVARNVILDIGRLLPGATAIQVGPSFDNRIEHNTIAHTRYSGIAVGWQWGFGAPSSGRNLIEGNALLDIGQRELSDMGAIYTVGPSPGTVVRGNLIREVHGYPDYGEGAWGVYNDDGSSGVTVEHNVVVGTDSGGYHVHNGRGVMVLGNLFALGMSAEVTNTRGERVQQAAELRDNVLVTRSSRPLAGASRAPFLAYSGNRVSMPRDSTAAALSDCAVGCSVGNAAVAPGPVLESFKLTGIPPAQQAIFDAVVAGAGAGRGSTGVTPLPPPEPAPSIAVVIDADAMAVARFPPGLAYEPRGDALEVVAQPGAPGGRCLRFSDGPEMTQPWEPYAYAQLNHRSGTTRAEFDVIVDGNADFRHEWRDNATPYHVGPTLRITRQGLWAGGQLRLPAETGHWLHIRVSAPLMPRAAWRLEAHDDEGRGVDLDGLAFGSREWSRAEWIGFVSDSTLRSQACIAAVSIVNTPPSSKTSGCPTAPATSRARPIQAASASCR